MKNCRTYRKTIRACLVNVTMTKVFFVLFYGGLVVSPTSLLADSVFGPGTGTPLFLRSAFFKYAGKVSANDLEGPPSPFSALMTDFYDVALGLSAVLLLVLLVWSISLRRRIKEQTHQIRLQMKREATLERNYQELFENANDVVYTHDLNGMLSSLNKAGEKILGCKRELAVGANMREFITPQQTQEFDKWLKNSLVSKVTPQFELEVLGKNGRRAILEVSTRVISPEGTPVGVEGIARDITERRRAEEALRQSEERFSSAFRLSPIPIAISTLSESRYLDVNESFLRLFGFKGEEVIGRTARELAIWADSGTKDEVDKVLKESLSVSGVECKFRSKSGDILTALVFIEPVALGSTPCMLFITHDITDRLRLEEQLRQATKMEAVGRLAAGVAHDFNNLLTVIQGNTAVVLESPQLNADLSKSLGQVADAAQRASNLTRQLLTFSRKQVMQPKALDLNELINNLTKMLKHLLNEEIVLKFNYGGTLPVILADPTMMEQVIMNLSINARDAMPKGGKLSITTSAVDIDKSYLLNHAEAREGRFVCSTVSDTGSGMDAATQSRIFEPFFTTKAIGKGTGLGLAIVYGIVKQHHGWIEVTSAPQVGSTFKIFLPANTSVVCPGKRQLSKRLRNSKETILVVEDEQSVGQLVRDILVEKGYRVLEAANGLEALQCWNEESGNVDLLLTDMRMPKEMSGHELAQNLRALKPDLKVIYTTGYSPEASGCDLDLVEGSNFLPKPYPPSKLVQIVRDCLNSTELSVVA